MAQPPRCCAVVPGAYTAAHSVHSIAASTSMAHVLYPNAPLVSARNTIFYTDAGKFYGMGTNTYGQLADGGTSAGAYSSGAVPLSGWDSAA